MNVKIAAAGAELSFWESVAKAFPAIKTGDLDPGAAITFSNACEKVVRQWLEANQPTGATDARIAALEVENWNLKYPVGVHVTVEMDSGEMRETVTRSKAEIAQAGYAVIFLQGITGYYLLQRVTPRTGIREDPYTDVSLMFADGKVISAAPKERRKS